MQLDIFPDIFNKIEYVSSGQLKFLLLYRVRKNMVQRLGESCVLCWFRVHPMFCWHLVGCFSDNLLVFSIAQIYTLLGLQDQMFQFLFREKLLQLLQKKTIWNRIHFLTDSNCSLSPIQQRARRILHHHQRAKLWFREWRRDFLHIFVWLIWENSLEYAHQHCRRSWCRRFCRYERTMQLMERKSSNFKSVYAPKWIPQLTIF